MPVKELAKLVSDYGSAIVGFSCLMVLVLAGGKLLYNYFDRKIKGPDNLCPRALSGDCPGRQIPTATLVNLINMNREAKTTRDLKHHQVFGTIRQYRSVSIPSLQINDPGRKLVFQNILLCKFKTIAIYLDKWLIDNEKEVQNNEVHGQFLYNSMITMVSDTINAYEQELKDDGIPLPALASFRVWHERSIDSLLDSMQGLSHSDWVSDSVQRVALIFTAIESSLERTLLDAEISMAKLNGSLTGLTYKGLVCGPNEDTAFKIWLDNRQPLPSLTETIVDMNSSGAKRLKALVEAAKKK